MKCRNVYKTQNFVTGKGLSTYAIENCNGCVNEPPSRKET